MYFSGASTELVIMTARVGLQYLSLSCTIYYTEALNFHSALNEPHKAFILLVCDVIILIDIAKTSKYPMSNKLRIHIATLQTSAIVRFRTVINIVVTQNGKSENTSTIL
jgi:hypothetical protein